MMRKFSKICERHREIGWKYYKPIDLASTAFASTTNFESVFAGMTEKHTKWKLWIITSWQERKAGQAWQR